MLLSLSLSFSARWPWRFLLCPPKKIIFIRIYYSTRTFLEGSFATCCFILSLCVFCVDLQRSTIKKWLVIDFWIFFFVFYTNILFYKNVLRRFICYLLLHSLSLSVLRRSPTIDNWEWSVFHFWFFLDDSLPDSLPWDLLPTIAAISSCFTAMALCYTCVTKTSTLTVGLL